MSATAAPSSSAAPAPPLTAPALAAALAAAFLAGRKAGPAVRGRLDSAPTSQPPPSAAPVHLAAATSQTAERMSSRDPDPAPLHQPPPAAATLPAPPTPRPRPLPPACRLRVENGGRQVSRPRSPKAAATSSLAQPPVAPTSLAGAAFDQLLKPSATSPIGPPPLDPNQADLHPVSRPAPAVLGSRHVSCCSVIDGEGGVAATLDALPTASAPHAAVASDGLIVQAPPVRPGWGDWLGCFDRVTASTVPVAPCGNALGGWQLVSRGRRSAPSAFRRPAVNGRRPPPAWLRDRCFRCLCRGHRAYSCRDPIRCTDCLRSGHIARFCRAKKPDHQASPLQCPAPSPASTGDVSMTDVQFQSISAEQVGLAEETELLRTELRDCLARVGSVLGRAEAALAKLEVAPDVSSLLELQIGVVPDVSLLPEIQVGFADEEAGMYGELSPRATSCRLPLPVVPIASGSEAVVEVVAPVLQIMPELQKICGEPTSPISMVLPKEMGSLRGYLVMPTATSPSSLEPVQPLFVDRGGLDAAIALSPEAVGQVASVGVEDDEVGALAPNSEAMKPIRSPIFDRDAMLARIDEAVFVKKLGRLLVSLEAACPGSGKTIACLLAEEVSTGKIKKVKKALRTIGKKSGAIGKASAAA